MHNQNRAIVLLLEACLDHEQTEINTISQLLHIPTKKQIQHLQFEQQLINAQRKEIAYMRKTGHATTQVKRMPQMHPTIAS